MNKLCECECHISSPISSACHKCYDKNNNNPHSRAQFLGYGQSDPLQYPLLAKYYLNTIHNSNILANYKIGDEFLFKTMTPEHGVSEEIFSVIEITSDLITLHCENIGFVRRPINEWYLDVKNGSVKEFIRIKETNKSCTCGAKAVGSTNHSSWC